MGIIKTALEIALEKTENVAGDKSSIDQFEIKQKGKKLANAFLSGETDIIAEIKKLPASEKSTLKQGVFNVLITQIVLPVNKDDEKRLSKIGQGLTAVLEKKEFSVLYNQFLQIIERYLKEFAHYEQAIRQQFAPKLKQKEEELSRRIGREIRIDPLQDPEFIAFYNQNIKALKSNYEAVVEQVREEIRQMYEN